MTDIPPLPCLLTAGRIADILDADLHRVIRVLNTRPHILPVAKAGVYRLYDQSAIAMVRHELNAIDARRGNGRRS